jgi:hypothetical protein
MHASINNILILELPSASLMPISSFPLITTLMMIVVVEDIDSSDGDLLVRINPAGAPAVSVTATIGSQQGHRHHSFHLCACE